LLATSMTQSSNAIVSPSSLSAKTLPNLMLGADSTASLLNGISALSEEIYLTIICTDRVCVGVLFP
jgi:hypothetical protein